MRDNNVKLKTILAFGTVLIVVIVAWLLNQFDRSRDVFPNENTTIILGIGHIGIHYMHKKEID